MSRFYDKDGTPLELFEWAKKFEQIDYKRIAQTILPNGTQISTVWLGSDHQYGDGPPLIFETMVFGAESHDEEDMERYSTLEEAQAGHEAMVRKQEAMRR